MRQLEGLIVQHKTFVIKEKDITRDWHIIDAQSVVLGRLATRIACLLRGKHKVTYTPGAHCGDKVIVINARHVKLTGRKYEDAVMYYHTGYPGGIKQRTMRQRLEGKRPEQVLMRAVSRMIPKGPLRIKQMANLYVYPDAEHKHAAQSPVVYDCSDIKRA